MTSKLELIYDEHRRTLITMSENNNKLLTIASGRDDNGNWVIMSRKRYNELKKENEQHGKQLLKTIL